MSKAYRMDVDPRSARVAQHLMASAMEEVATLRVRHGVGHYEARERVLRDVSGDWVAQAGKETADAAVRGLHYLSAGEYLTRRERGALAARERSERREVLASARTRQAAQDREYAAYLREHAPHLLPAPQRALRTWLMMALVALTMATGGLFAMVGPAGAVEPSPRWKALAACGVVKMDSPDYERRCRRFSRTERNVTRDYDGPGAGAPRDWERPKDWE
jgi:hypothetical protein